MAESRWYQPEELADMCRPTMDRAIEAIEAGETVRALELCSAMKHEWRFLHDLMAESILGLVTYIQEAFGEEHIAHAWIRSMERGWKRDAGSGTRSDSSPSRKRYLAPAGIDKHTEK